MEHAAYICEAREVDWPQVFEPDLQKPSYLSSQLGIRRIPSIWVVDKNSIIRAAHVKTDELPTILDGLFED